MIDYYLRGTSYENYFYSYTLESGPVLEAPVQEFIAKTVESISSPIAVP